MAPAVEVTELVKVIGEKIIVDRISFTVDEGEIFGLLGHNGSGKTTTFNMLSGLLSPSSGTINILGKNIREVQKSKPEIGFVTQENSVYDSLTVMENIEFFASGYGIGGNEARVRAEKLLSEVRLANKKDVLASRLSGGMKRRLNIACSLVHEPKVVFLDEPTVGLDPIIRREIWAIVQDLHARGKTVIITSHYMEEIEQLCDKVAIMFSGRMVASGTPEELKRRYKLKQMEDVFAHLMKPVT